MGLSLSYKDTFATKSPDTSLLSAPTAQVEYDLTADADLKSDEIKALKDVIDAEFQKKMKAWKAEQEKKFDDAIKWTVENYKKKKEAAVKSKQTDKFQAEMSTFAETANKLLQQGIQALQSTVESAAKEIFKKAFESVAKKMKRAITLKKVGAVLKIIAFAGIIIATAALSIAATVLTGGAAFPLILGAIATGAGALKKIYDTANAAWPSRAKAATRLADALDGYLKAVAYELKKQEDEQIRSLGPKERIKRALNSISGKRKDVESAASDFAKWGNLVKLAIEELYQKTEALSGDVEKLAKAGFDAKTKEFLSMDQGQKKAAIQLKRLLADNKGVDDLVKEVKDALAAEVPDQGKFTGLIGKLQSLANSPLAQDIKTGIDLLSGGVTAGKKFAKAA